MGLETDTRERTTTYDRILVKCSDLNNQIDYEERGKAMLTNAIKELES